MNEYDEQHDQDDSVDSDPADSIVETPDPEAAAEPVDNVGEVIGRRNLDLPLEVQKASRPLG